MALDSVTISPGDELAFTLRLTNIGDSPAKLPWTPHGADVEPNRLRSYTYVQLVPLMRMHSTSVSEVTDLDDSVFMSALFAPSDWSSNVVSLRPGEWVEVHDKQIYHPGHTRLAERLHRNGLVEFDIKGDALLSSVRFVPKAPIGPARLKSTCNQQIEFVPAGELRLSVALK